MKYSRALVVLSLSAAASVTLLVHAEETASNEGATVTPPEDTFNAQEHTDWGSYYDPQNVYCGKFDCYKILGFDYEEFGKEHPDTRTITKRYRALSRIWHPDKNRSRKAKDRFVKIARAYEVLTNEKTRKEYDDLRYDQELYMSMHGSSVLWSYAPKSDTLFVLIFLTLMASAASWWMQKQRWQNVADRLTQAAVEDATPRDGGTPESKELRERALEILAEREKEASESNHGGSPAAAAEASNGNKSPSLSKRQSKRTQVKLTTSEKKKLQQEALRPIVKELVSDITDFGAGYHQPTWRDLFVVKLAKMPLAVTKGVLWNGRYLFNRLRGLPLNDDEREVLTRRAIGEVNWVSSTEDERKEMLKRDLWKASNMQEWEEEQEVKQLSAGDRKLYNRMKKKGKGQEFFYKED